MRSAVGFLSGALLLASSAISSIIPPVNGPRRFDLTLTWEENAPQGIAREMVLINGAFPGPRLEILEGEDVIVTVHNKMPFNTTIHFHGIEMEGTNWSDGVPGLTQRQIPTGQSFPYKWTATQYGSYWYHAHQRGQLDDGCYGAIIIHPKKERQTPFSLITQNTEALKAIDQAVVQSRQLILADFRNAASEEVYTVTRQVGFEQICTDVVLLNGKGHVDCWSDEKRLSLLTPDRAGILAASNDTNTTPKGCLTPASIIAALAGGLPTNLTALPPSYFDVCTPTQAPDEVISVTKKDCECYKFLAIDIIGEFGLLATRFAIDETSFWVYAVDGEFIEPQLVQAIDVSNGDRYSILIQLHDKAPGDYTIRVASTTTAQMIAGFGTLSYRHQGQPIVNRTSTPIINDVGGNLTEAFVLYSQAIQKQLEPLPVAQTADQEFQLTIRIAGASYNWALNNTPYSLELDNANPLLFDPAPSRENNVTVTTKNGTWVDFVIVTGSVPMPPHPIHKHSNKMFVIGQGSGQWKWNSVAEAIQAEPESFNLVDPPHRDTVNTPGAITDFAWLVLRYQVVNPGAWLLHCHIQSHFLGGMQVAIQDGIDEWPKVPAEYLELESSW